MRHLPGGRRREQLLADDAAQDPQGVLPRLGR
jgi:hypothetical protein